MTRQASSSNESLRVLHLTDPHLFADRDGELRGKNTYDTFNAVLDHVRRSGWAADVIACTGDIIQDDSAAAYDNFRKLLEPLGLPVHCVPGNHDVRALMQAALASPPFTYCAAVPLNHWLMVGIDSCVSGSAGGHVADAELDRLDAAIAASDAAHVVVCLHHPPADVGSKWLDTVGIDNGNEFLERINASGRVRLALFGHVHQVYDRQHGGVRVIGTPSTCRQFKPLSDEFAVDERAPAYRRITLHADGSFDHDLVWIDDA